MGWEKPRAVRRAILPNMGGPRRLAKVSATKCPSRSAFSCSKRGRDALGKTKQIVGIVLALDLNQAIEVRPVIGAQVVGLGAVNEFLVALVRGERLHGNVEFSKPGLVAGDGRFVIFWRTIEVDGRQDKCVARAEGCRHRGKRSNCPTRQAHIPDTP